MGKKKILSYWFVFFKSITLSIIFFVLVIHVCHIFIVSAIDVTTMVTLGSSGLRYISVSIYICSSLGYRWWSVLTSQELDQLPDFLCIFWRQPYSRHSSIPNQKCYPSVALILVPVFKDVALSYVNDSQTAVVHWWVERRRATRECVNMSWWRLEMLQISRAPT